MEVLREMGMKEGDVWITTYSLSLQLGVGNNVSGYNIIFEAFCILYDQ